MFAHPEVLGKKALHEWASKTNYKSLPEHVKKMHEGGDVPADGIYELQEGEKVIPASHAGFRATTITHHDDGSATIRHDHHDGSYKEYAVANLEDMHHGIESHLRSPHEIEEFLKAHGIDPEKLEELIEPGLHDKALDYIAEQLGIDPDDIEEKVSPGVHQKMAEAIKD
jgi:hypothetical protein